MNLPRVMGFPACLKPKAANIRLLSRGRPRKAINRPTGEDTVKAQLSKLGGSLYYPDSIEISIDGGLMVPLSSLNSLRRRAVDALDEARVESLTKVKSFTPENMFWLDPRP